MYLRDLCSFAFYMMYLYSHLCFCREIEITDFTYTVFKAFLQFFYTDDVNVPLKDAIGFTLKYYSHPFNDCAITSIEI